MLQVGGESWYGGGCDLTPAYFYETDARHFHQSWKKVCEDTLPGSYAKYKAWCDSYFYIPARKEHRGIGGIFFDDLEESSDGSITQVIVSICLEWTCVSSQVSF